MDEITRYLMRLRELWGDVKRARGPFLYTQSGTRLTDLYQDDGRAILGWGAGDGLTVMKRVSDRGATGSYLTAQHHRLVRAVADLMSHVANETGEATPDEPPLEVLAFAHEGDCVECASAIAGRQVRLWRPWLNEAKPAAAGERSSAKMRPWCASFCPPLPWGGGVYLLAAGRDAIEHCCAGQSLEKAMILPPPVEAAAARAIYDLIAALSTRCEQQWFLYDNMTMRYWRRQGPYLYPKVAREAYNAFCEHCLKLGIVVNPLFDGMSIVPFGAGRGVFAPLVKVPFELPNAPSTD